MKYISTENNITPLELGQAIQGKPASDGGLYVPETIPVLPKAFFNNISEMSLRDIAYVVTSAYFSDSASPTTLKRIVDEAFAFDIPLVSVDNGIFIAELFHGPTLTVKDFGARVMARLFELLPKQKRTVIVSTTGNTGAAVANGFVNKENVNVVVLFPHGCLSRMTVAQFASLGQNIHPVEVYGTIEDCKRLAMEAMADAELAELNLCSGNSLNIARIVPLAAISLYVYSRLLAMEIPHADSALYFMPGGNLSNLVAAAMAAAMGMPIGGLVASTNINSPLSGYLGNLDTPTASQPVKTLTAAVDMTCPSNIPRLKWLMKKEPLLASKIHALSISDADTAAIINALRTKGYTIDPHGALAYAAALRHATDAPRVVFATGHPAKQLDVMTAITGGVVELPVQLTRFMSVKRHPALIPPTLSALRKLIIQNQ